MCKKSVCLLAFVLMIGLSGAVQATTYYVSPSGNDANSGTSPSEAWASTDKVNSTTFSPGDSILFEGGETFQGGLVFTSGGTPTSPITLSSYGTGRATIQGDLKETVLLVDNCAGFEISDLIFRGSGNTHLTIDLPDFYGIRFFANAGSGVKLEYIRIDNVEVCDVTNRGIFFDALDFSGFKDVEVTNSIVHDIGSEGINSSTGGWPVTMHSHEDFYIADCVVYDVTGIEDMGSHSGSGIVFGGLNGCVIEFCEAYNTGELCFSDGGGPLGIWAWECNNVVIQHCESHHNLSNTGDGGGFDLDGGVQNSIIQYNYSHDNYGCGYLICQFGGANPFINNTYRYNISENDGTGGMAGVFYWTGSQSEGMSNIHFYNNTIYNGPNSLGSAIEIMSEDMTGCYIRNNIFVTTDGKPVVEVLGKSTSVVTFQGNCYWSSGDDFLILWGRNKTYTSLDAWRTASDQEMVGSEPVGIQANPLLTDAGGGGTIGDPCLLETLDAYKLMGASPVIDEGLDLYTLFGTDVGTRDFYGLDIPSNGVFDIGAHEYDQSLPEDTNAPSPDPMTWATVPYGASESSISMTATTATDDSGVEYYFECTAGDGNDSGWQDETTYVDVGLVPSTQYSYRVQARDKSLNQNTTAWSSTESATTLSADTTAPTPDPMTWATVPYATGAYSIEMVATTATDENGVEYYFECTAGDGNDSGWQDSPVYENTGLSPNTPYSYRVQARDKSINQNTTGFSGVESATTDAADSTAPSPDPMTWAVVPYAIGSSIISMTATTATDVSGVEYYFECTAGGGNDSDWQDNTDYTDIGLDPNNQYSYRVQARDKSPNQNATAWSTTESATTMSAVTLFSDGFESGDLVTGGWTSDGVVDVSKTADYTGTYGVELQLTGWIEKAVSTAGYTNIQVKFACETKGLDSGENLFVEWWDGSDWNEADAIRSNDWILKDIALGSGADNNSSFKLRFRVLSSNPNEELANVDDVEVAGVLQ
ncbi:MAG: hypothetical protein JSV82_06605 [Planctomycetota bacterium]|nr:MAG: hypothetical protein JSV82_06605 [Planctomycetota bacterium]